jgi:hypothetical protein
MSVKHWLIERPTVNIVFTLIGKMRREPEPRMDMTERWVIAQKAGNHTVRYWRGSGRKTGTVWTADPERACHYPSRAVALYDASQMNQRHMKATYEAQILD